MCLCLARVVPIVNTNGVLGLGFVKGFHNALFNAAPRLPNLSRINFAVTSVTS